MINFNDIKLCPKKEGHQYHLQAVTDGALPILNRVFPLQRAAFFNVGHSLLAGRKVRTTIHPRNSTIRED